MGKFEKRKELTKSTFTKNTWYDWYDWLIEYIPEPRQKTVGEVKGQIMSLFKTKDYNKPEPVKIVYEGGKKLSKPKIQNIRNPFRLKKKKKKSKTEYIFEYFLKQKKKKKKKRN